MGSLPVIFVIKKFENTLLWYKSWLLKCHGLFYGVSYTFFCSILILQNLEEVTRRKVLQTLISTTCEALNSLFIFSEIVPTRKNVCLNLFFVTTSHWVPEWWGVWGVFVFVFWYFLLSGFLLVSCYLGQCYKECSVLPTSGYIPKHSECFYNTVPRNRIYNKNMDRSV